jgi:hypothetical protein
MSVSRSQYAVTYLKILSLLLSSATTTRVLGPQGLQLSVEITQYLLNRGLYPLLSKAITAIVSLPFIIQTGALSRVIFHQVFGIAQ